MHRPSKSESYYSLKYKSKKIMRYNVIDSRSVFVPKETTFYAIRNFIEDNDYSGNVAQKDLPVVSYFSRPINILFEKPSVSSFM